MVKRGPSVSGGCAIVFTISPGRVLMADLCRLHGTLSVSSASQVCPTVSAHHSHDAAWHAA